jgi:hypothetical protein
MTDFEDEEDSIVAEYRDAVAGIRRGLAQANAGLGQSVDEVFDAIDNAPTKDVG